VLAFFVTGEGKRRWSEWVHFLELATGRLAARRGGRLESFSQTRWPEQQEESKREKPPPRLKKTGKGVMR